MGDQSGGGLGQLGLGGWIIRQGGGLEGGVEIVPDGIHLVLEFVGVGSDGDDDVFVGNDDAKLAVGAVAAKGIMGATPELEPVALTPIDAPF